MASRRPTLRVRMGSLTALKWRVSPRRLVVAAIAFPFVALLVTVATREWYPSSDQAIQVLQIGEVGTEHSPQVGAYSRWGFNHPGPMLYYLAAPLALVAGNVGVLVAVGAINAAGSIVACVVAWRRGGSVLLGIVCTVLLLLLRTVGMSRLVDPWNPHSVLVALFALALVCWSVAERDVWFLPVAVALGSFAVQAHVGTASVVAALGISGVALSWRTRSARADGAPRLLGEGWLKPGFVSGGVALLVWLPPFVEQVRNNPGNLTQLVRFARDPAEPPSGFGTGLQVAAAHFRVPPGWVTGLDERASALDPSVWSWLSALIVFASLAVLGWLAARRGARDALRLAVLAVVMIVAGILGVSRTSGEPFAYLLRTWWSVGAFAWLSILWSTWRLVQGRLALYTRALALADAGVVAVLTAVLTVGAIGVDVPFRATSDALEVLAPTARDELAAALPDDAQVVVRWADQRNLGALGIGMFLYLDQNGFDVFVAPKHELAFDSWHIRPREEVEPTLWVVGSDDVLTGISIPSTAIELAAYDPLTAAARARHDELWIGIATDSGVPAGTGPKTVDNPSERRQLVAAGADVAEIDELRELRTKSSGYFIYLLEGPPG